jgi:hypothetical protein
MEWNGPKETPEQRIAYALGGLSRVASTNVNPRFVEASQFHSMTETQHNFAPSHLPAHDTPQNHRVKDDITKFSERALGLRDAWAPFPVNFPLNWTPATKTKTKLAGGTPR